MAAKILLDTDIGDDIDDALALALICCSPEVELVGVTTVFGNTPARARQAQTVLRLAGDTFIGLPVAVGCGATLASRKITAAHGDLDHLPGQHKTTLSDDKLWPFEPRHGVDFLIDHLLTGDVIPVTIGAMTNLAMALVKEPRLANKIPRIVSMAAEFQRPMPEWNIRCDPEAAHIVFASGIPMDVIPFTIGKMAMFTLAETDRLSASKRPLANYLGSTLEAWRVAVKNPQALASLFDPMAIAAIIEPALFEWRTGRVAVELRGEQTYGYTTFIAGDGPHKVAWSTDRDTAIGWYLKRILGI